MDLIDEHKISYSQLFNLISIGNSLHVKIGVYSLSTVRKECCLQNKIAKKPKIKCKYAILINKFTTVTTEKKGYITIKRNW